MRYEFAVSKRKTSYKSEFRFTFENRVLVIRNLQSLKPPYVTLIIAIHFVDMSAAMNWKFINIQPRGDRLPISDSYGEDSQDMQSKIYENKTDVFAWEHNFSLNVRYMNSISKKCCKHPHKRRCHLLTKLGNEKCIQLPRQKIWIALRQKTSSNLQPSEYTL